MAVTGIRYYGVEGHVNAESPIVKWKAQAAGTFTKNTFYMRNATHDTLVAVTVNATRIIGLCEFDQEVQAGELVELRLAVGNIWWKQVDYADAAVAGVTLDLAAGGKALEGTGTKEARVMLSNKAGEGVVFRLQSKALLLGGDV